MARTARLLLALFALLATPSAAAGAASSSSSTSSVSTTSSPTTRSTAALRATSGRPSSTPAISQIVVDTTLPALPSGLITTKLPGNSPLPLPFLPVDADQVTGEAVALTLNGPTVACWYPISGNYGTLPRILFYLIILAALVLRHHQWLYAGALVAALTYSGSAAIQAICMAFAGRSWADLDLIPIYTILGLSATLAIPLLNWSDTLRNVGRNENEDLTGPQQCTHDRQGEPREQEFKRASRMIILYWTFLISFAFLCVFAIMVPYWIGNGENAWSPYLFDDAIDLQCTPPNGAFVYSGESDSFNTTVVTQEFANDNNCLDPCGQFDNWFTLFRSTYDLQPTSVHYLLRFEGFSDTKIQRHNTKFINLFYAIYPLIFPYLFLQGVYAAVLGRRTPAQARNLLYAVLTRVRFSKQRTPLDPAGPQQRWIAKFLAQLAYLGAIWVFVLAVPLVIIAIVAAEIFMWDLPESESPWYIGQWMPWTNVGLALLAALGTKFHDDIIFFVSLSFFKTIWLTSHPSWPYRQYWQGRGSGKLYNAKARNIFTGEDEEMPDHGLYRRTAGNVINRGADHTGHFLGRKWRGLRDGFTGEWQQFAAFWHDPESSRSNQGRTLRLYAEPCQCTWGCSCPRSQVQGRCRHEEGVCSHGRDAKEECSHYPVCEHSRQCSKARMRKQRLRLLNPERRTVAMLVGSAHKGVLQLDMTKTPIPFKSIVTSPSIRRALSRDDHTEGSESEMDEKMAGVVPPFRANDLALTRSRSLPSQVKRMFTRRGNALGGNDRTRPSPPVSKPSDESRTTQHSQPELTQDPSTSQRRGQGLQKDNSVNVREEPIHPLLRDSYLAGGGLTHSTGEERPALRPPRVVHPEDSRRRSMLKELPDTPKITRTPHPTPNLDTRSLGSGVSAVSPIGLMSENTNNSRADDVSPELPSSHGTLQDSSGRITKAATPLQLEAPSDEDERYDAARSSTGLTTSFERGIMSRQRRSQVYGPDIPRDRNLAGRSDSAPIPVHLEEQSDSEAFNEQYEGSADADTDAELLEYGPQEVHEDFDHEDTASEGQSESVATSEVPPIRKRHIAELVQFLPGPRESSGAFLSPKEKHQLLDPPSGASTPPIQLPLLSPPDPNSNTARAGNAILTTRSPHLSLGSVMFTPNRHSGLSSLRQGDRTSGQTGDRVAVPSNSADEANSGGHLSVGPTSAPREHLAVPDGLAGIDAAVQRQRSPRPPDYRSTVDYLQVHRPTTMVFADEIVLRKDEFGQYRIVMNGDEKVGNWEFEKVASENKEVSKDGGTSSS